MEEKQTLAWQAAEIFSAHEDQAQTPSLKLLAMSLMSAVDEFSANAWAGAVVVNVIRIPESIESLQAEKEALASEIEARQGAIEKLQEIYAAYLSDTDKFSDDMDDWADAAITAERAANIAFCGVTGDDDEADEG